jgi:hypothetical protein
MVQDYRAFMNQKKTGNLTNATEDFVQGRDVTTPEKTVKPFHATDIPKLPYVTPEKDRDSDQDEYQEEEHQTVKLPVRVRVMVSPNPNEYMRSLQIHVVSKK